MDKTAAQSSRDAYNEEIVFLQAWERGEVPLIGGCVRVRQIRRALAEDAERLTGKKLHSPELLERRPGRGAMSVYWDIRKTRREE